MLLKNITASRIILVHIMLTYYTIKKPAVFPLVMLVWFDSFRRV